jgi:hypothetical protein
MKRLLLAAIVACLVLGASSPAALAGTGNPARTGPPGQSCQEIEAEGGTVPGRSNASPGSPFNEEGIDSEEGGIGGQHYTEASQYDVACFHVSTR